MKMLCPKCSTECLVSTPSVDTATCSECGLLLFVSDAESAPERQMTPSAAGAMSQTVSYQMSVAPAPSEFFAVPQRVGRYRISEFIGAGGYARVYRGEDEELQREVAIKVLRNEKFDSKRNIRQFFDEARTSAQLEHPGIVPVHDVGTDESGVHYIVMQYIRGTTLNDRIHDEPVSPEEAADIVAQIAEAVHYAHKQQFVHRDLKPANILIDVEGRPYVADFGLAMPESKQWKHEGEVAGTLLFMAPEQVRGETHRLDGRTDIWSIGAILYVLLTGRPPFTAPYNRLAEEILLRDPRPPRQIDDAIPRELERICLKCLSKNVRDRYSSAIDLADELRSWLTQSGPVAESQPTHRLQHAPAKSGRRRPIGLAETAIVCSIVALALVLALIIPRDDDNPEDVGEISSVNDDVIDLFDVDNQAIPDRWHPLFAADPKLTDWPADPLAAPLNPNKELKSISLQNNNSGMLSYGKTHSESFEIEVQFSRTARDSLVGIFLGYEEFNTKQDEAEKIHTNWVYLTGEPSTDPDYRVTRVIAHPTMGWPQLYTAWSDSVEAPLVDTGTLSVVVRLGRIVKVKWNNHTLRQQPDDGGKKWNVPVIGEFGIFVQRGGATFHSGRFRLLTEGQ